MGYRLLLSQTLFRLKGTYVNIIPLSLSPRLVWNWTVGSKGTVSTRFKSMDKIHHQIRTPESEPGNNCRWLAPDSLQLNWGHNINAIWSYVSSNGIPLSIPRGCRTCSVSNFAMISSDCNEREPWNIQLKTTFTIIAFIMGLKIMTPRGKDYRNTPKYQDDIAIGILFYSILWRERRIMML